MTRRMQLLLLTGCLAQLAPTMVAQGGAPCDEALPIVHQSLGSRAISLCDKISG